MITYSPKNAVSSLFLSPYTLHSKTLTVVFEGDPLGSPNKTCMAAISDRNYTLFKLGIPRGSRDF